MVEIKKVIDQLKLTIFFGRLQLSSRPQIPK